MDQLSYCRHRFPPAVIQHAIWLYLPFHLSYRDVEDLLAERGLEISYETVRRWVLKFGPGIARTCGAVGHARAIDGTSTRCWSGLPVNGCTCGAPSIMKARSSTCWCSDSATSRLHSG